MKSNKFFSIVLSMIMSGMSFLSLFTVTYAATTISTDINTGGTLTVTGVSTFNGAVNASSALQATGATTLYSTLNVSGLSTLGNASSTVLTVSGNTYLATTTLISGGSLTLGTLASDPGGPANGQMYYSTGSNAIRVYQGGSWSTLGAANGWTRVSPTVYPTTMADQFLIGTTTVSGLSQLTVEATSTVGVPLTLRGYNGQTANLFQIKNVGNTNLFAIDASGNASTTMISTTGNIWVNGFATTTASNGNFTTSGSIGVASSSPYVALGVMGTTTSSGGMVIGSAGSPINNILFGTCTVDPNDGPLLAGAATTTNCTASGVLAGDKVFVTPSNLPAGLFMVSASSTAGAIQVSIGAASSTSPSVTSYAGWSWMSVR